MAIITFSPLIVAASGKVKDTVFSRWKGRPYIRARVTPANPQSSGQVKQRAISTAGVTLWQNMHADLVAAWNLYASPYSIAGYNACQKRNTSTATPGGSGTAARMELACALFPALMQPTPGAKEFEVLGIQAAGSGVISVTWTIGTWIAADSVYIACWDETGITYYPAPVETMSKTAGNAGTYSITGLTPANAYTVAVLAYHLAEDAWTLNAGEKAVNPGA